MSEGQPHARNTDGDDDELHGIRAALCEARAELQRANAARAESDAQNRAKDDFIATVSHELRTPLHAILGWARLLRNGRLPPEKVAHALATIERNAQVQTELIEDLLDMSRILSGKLRLDLRSMKLCTVVRDAVESALPTSEARGVTLTLEPYDGEACALGDPDRAHQIVGNLLSNAVKFTPRGGHVWVRVRDEGPVVSVAVHDTGIGIAPELLPHVFDRFRQADDATSRAHGGLGLGLAIVRHLAELHGGTVCGESDGAGHGATFTARFPRYAAHERTREPAARPAGRLEPCEQPDARALSGVKVVVVDDDADARDLVSSVLSQYGADVTAAASTAEAMVALRVVRPEVLVSDIGMPVEDGYALIRRVRGGAHDEASGVPALALTAFARSDDARRALEAGYQMHAAKPIEPTALVALVRKLAGR